ncbi:MAG: hypothetical protein SXV54_10895 [Chloroflexota bacterium]|nr:hypothetical protein [Chloroflexota bacterium]
MMRQMLYAPSIVLVMRCEQRMRQKMQVVHYVQLEKPQRLPLSRLIGDWVI